MNVIEKLNEYGLTEKQYEELMQDIESIKNGTCKCETDKWQYLIDKYNLQWNKDSLRKSQDIIGGAFAYNYMKEKYAKQNNSDDEYIKELEEKKREAKLETIKLRDKLREMNKVDYAQARFENLKDVMIEEIQNLSNMEIKPFKPYQQTNDFVVASVLISDLHLGLICDNDFNKYNIEIAKERMNILKSKVACYCQVHNVSKLNIELLGDLASGFIHTSLRVQQEEDAISNIMTVCEVLANFINDLKPYVADIKVYSVYGNHGRIIPNKKEAINIENVERLIPFYLRARLDNTVEIIDSKNDYLELNVMGRKIVIAHGDKDNLNNAVNNYTRLLRYVPDEIHIAHLHFAQSKDDCDTDILINGSVVSTDDYALSIRKSTKPSQTMRVYLGDDVCTYKIML